jgi:uncharacterized protein (DUF362 family)
MGPFDCTNTTVATATVRSATYPPTPFSPSVYHRELCGLPYKLTVQDESSGDVYTAVRTILADLGLDAAHYGTPHWNPFLDMVKPGQDTIIKPNLVLDQHPLGKAGTECTITHASVVRPLIDYVLLATKGSGRITICDVPLQSANWDALLRDGGYRDLIRFYQTNGVEIGLFDFRTEIAVFNRDKVIVRREPNHGDPRGYLAVDLGTRSAFMPVIDRCRRFRITDYPHRTVAAHHNYKKNEYLIPKSILDAAFFLNVPKLKTHRKSGMTCAMKNLIGINGDKSWIAHHTAGSPRTGGDEFAHFRLKTYLIWHCWAHLKSYKCTLWLAVLIKRLYYLLVTQGRTIEELKFSGEFTDDLEGSWYGNDTLWRCVADLNQIILCATSCGMIADSQQRNYLAIVDAVIAGQGEGPMQNTPKASGMILGGFNPLCIDEAGAMLMGFAPNKIPNIHRTREMRDFIYVPHADPGAKMREKLQIDPFVPAQTWRGHVEKD